MTPADPWLRRLSWLLKVCQWLALPGVLLGIGARRADCPLWPDARVLLLTAGTAALGQVVLLATGVLPWPSAASTRRRQLALITMTCIGLAAIAAGVHQIAPSRGVALLGLPLAAETVLGGGLLLVRGARMVPHDLRETSWVWRVPRVEGAILLCIGTVAALLVLGAIDLSRDECA